MNRKELVEKLEKLTPALAKDALVPAYTRFTFDGGHLYASRDELTILAECEDVGKFAVDGRTFMGLMQNSGSEEVEFKLTEENLVLKAGKSTFKLPFFEEEDFLFQKPTVKWDIKLPVNEHLLKGIKICLMTAAREEHMKKIMGVCFNADMGAMYSCDGDAISSYGVQVKGKGSYLLPVGFCEQILRLVGAADTATLHIHSEWAMVEISNGYAVYGRMPAIDDMFDYEGKIQDALADEPTYVSVPKGLAEALARAQVIADIESAPTQIKVAKGKLNLTTSTHMGDVEDTLEFKGHPDTEALVHPSLMQRSVSIFEKMAVLEHCTVYVGEDAMQVVSNIGE